MLAAVDTASPPVLVYCRSGARAAALGVAHAATRSEYGTYMTVKATYKTVKAEYGTYKTVKVERIWHI